MYPAAFAYHAAGSFDHAVELLSLHEDAKLLAGGCSLIPIMKLRMAQPGHLIDLGRVPGSRYVIEQEGWLRLGALTREADLERSGVIAMAYPILADAAAVIADPLVRNMGTVGGNIAHGDPANDHPAVMLALGAQFVARGPGGTRLIEVDEFFVDLFETALGPGEVLTEIRIPAATAGNGGSYVKFEEQVGDFAVVGAAAQIRLEEGCFSSARVALTNIANVAVRVPEAERLLVGAAPNARRIEAAAEAAAASVEPPADLRATSAVKRELLVVAVRRALTTAIERAVDRR